MGADVKGDAYEGLLERNASVACTNIKSDASQYLTPRTLTGAMVGCAASARPRGKPSANYAAVYLEMGLA